MFTTLLVAPLYNCFIFLIGLLPGGDVGLAIIVLTLVLRIVFYPAFAASIRTQMGMQAVQEELSEINTKYKDDATERAKQTMALYKANNISPFASLLALLVQLPVFLALYFAFFREGLPNVDAALLYSFVHVPQMINLQFLWFINLLTPHNIILSAVVGGLQYLVTHFTLARSTPKHHVSPDKQAAQKMQQRMMLYFLPAFMTIIAYSLPAAVGLYFAAGNAVSLGQEWVIRRQMSKKTA